MGGLEFLASLSFLFVDMQTLYTCRCRLDAAHRRLGQLRWELALLGVHLDHDGHGAVACATELAHLVHLTLLPAEQHPAQKCQGSINRPRDCRHRRESRATQSRGDTPRTPSSPHHSHTRLARDTEHNTRHNFHSRRASVSARQDASRQRGLSNCPTTTRVHSAAGSLNLKPLCHHSTRRGVPLSASSGLRQR